MRPRMVYLVNPIYDFTSLILEWKSKHVQLNLFYRISVALWRLSQWLRIPEKWIKFKIRKWSVFSGFLVTVMHHAVLVTLLISLVLKIFWNSWRFLPDNLFLLMPLVGMFPEILIKYYWVFTASLIPFHPRKVYCPFRKHTV